MSNKPFLQNLNGQKTEHIPFWFMRQAGRYLPEYRELRARKKGFLNTVYDPETACEITIQPLRRFGMDAAILFSDILVIPHALGQHLEFVTGEGPKLNPIRANQDLSSLSFDKLDENLSPIYETLRQITSALKKENFNQTALIGFAGSPWTVACYMVEGQGSKDFMETKILSHKDPETFEKLINILVEATSEYLIKQADAGAEALQLFDSWAGALDTQGFIRWVIEPTKQIVKNIKAVHPNISVIGFPRMAGYNTKLYAQETGIDALALDTQIPTDFAAQNLQTLMPVQGNLDPAILMAGGQALDTAANRILDDLSQAPFVFNLGHGIHKDTPISHVERLADIIKKYKS